MKRCISKIRNLMVSRKSELTSFSWDCNDRIKYEKDHTMQLNNEMGFLNKIELATLRALPGVGGIRGTI